MVNLFTEDYEQDRNPVKRKLWVEELLNTLEAMSIENIKYYQRELGFYMGLKERVKSHTTAARIDIILHMTRYIIEENCEDVKRWRVWKKRYCGV
ncbi:MAG: hypothetical protein ABIK28_05480 [Planctomycetota bacterium]